MKYISFLFTFVFSITMTNVFSWQTDNNLAKQDTNEVIHLNNLAYENRLVDPEQTLLYADKALALSQRLNYLNGIAESYRQKGIAKFYQNESAHAYDNYLTSLNYFRKNGNLEGEAKVYNNIGNLYRDIEYDKGLEFFKKALIIAKKLQLKDLIGGIHLNMGNIYQKKKNYNQALKTYNEGNVIFSELNHFTGLTQSLQNMGVCYYKLNLHDKAESYLVEAIKNAKENDLNFIIASTNLTLTSVYIDQARYKEAQAAINEGVSYAKIINDSKLQYDYLYTSYELESKKKNYQNALNYLVQVYKIDSINYKNNVSDKINLINIQNKQRDEITRKELTIAKQRNAEILFIGSTAVACLAFMVILLLVFHVKRKAKTNKQLNQLNKEISQQKENLDKINHSLEEIIEDRTKDLKIKNHKLSQYSSHLSHQIRGPVATLKGLMLLEKDNLIENQELMREINKCVCDIDDQIININETLNDSNVPGFRTKI